MRAPGRPPSHATSRRLSPRGRRLSRSCWQRCFGAWPSRRRTPVMRARRRRTWRMKRKTTCGMPFRSVHPRCRQRWNPAQHQALHCSV
eukprot:3244960-Pleurochrysis_carterae.AAC.4